MDPSLATGNITTPQAPAPTPDYQGGMQKLIAAGYTPQQAMSYAVSKGYTGGAPSTSTGQSSPISVTGAAPDTSQPQGSWLSNVGNDALGVGEGLANIVLHPINTVRTLGSLPLGAGEGVARLIGQGVTGQQLPKMSSEVTLDNIGQHYAQAYGSPQKILNSVLNHPVSTALDASALLDGGASAVGAAGDVADAAGSANLAANLGKTSDVMNAAGHLINPITGTIPAIKAVSHVAGNIISGVGNAIAPETMQTISDAGAKILANKVSSLGPDAIRKVGLTPIDGGIQNVVLLFNNMADRGITNVKDLGTVGNAVTGSDGLANNIVENAVKQADPVNLESYQAPPTTSGGVGVQRDSILNEGLKLAQDPGMEGSPLKPNGKIDTTSEAGKFYQKINDVVNSIGQGFQSDASIAQGGNNIVTGADPTGTLQAIRKLNSDASAIADTKPMIASGYRQIANDLENRLWSASDNPQVNQYVRDQLNDPNVIKQFQAIMPGNAQWQSAMSQQLGEIAQSPTAASDLRSFQQDFVNSSKLSKAMDMTENANGKTFVTGDPTLVGVAGRAVNGLKNVAENAVAPALQGADRSTAVLAAIPKPLSRIGGVLQSTAGQTALALNNTSNTTENQSNSSNSAAVTNVVFPSASPTTTSGTQPTSSAGTMTSTPALTPQTSQTSGLVDDYKQANGITTFWSPSGYSKMISALSMSGLTDLIPGFQSMYQTLGPPQLNSSQEDQYGATNDTMTQLNNVSQLLNGTAADGSTGKVIPKPNLGAITSRYNAAAVKAGQTGDPSIDTFAQEAQTVNNQYLAALSLRGLTSTELRQESNGILLDPTLSNTENERRLNLMATQLQKQQAGLLKEAAAARTGGILPADPSQVQFAQ